MQLNQEMLDFNEENLSSNSEFISGALNPMQLKKIANLDSVLVANHFPFYHEDNILRDVRR